MSALAATATCRTASAVLRTPAWWACRRRTSFSKCRTTKRISGKVAEYFASIEPIPWIRVVETANVPKTRVVGGMFVSADEAGTEPIGHRIVEVPEDRARTELRDAASGFVAYVPAGSLKRGETLVTTGGGGKTVRCGICHGEDLRGLGSVPAIAGRSPSYTVANCGTFSTVCGTDWKPT